MKPGDVAKIVVVFKTHLDVGFTGLAREVRKQYLESHLPRAMALSKQVRDSGGSFVWTTGSWLVCEALETCKGKRLRELEAAISSGHIVWHGMPFTVHSELADASLFRFMLSLSKTLDRRFGRNTIAAKMSDVPGHTRAVVPLLAEAGIRFLHIGVNPASTPPDVPRAFVWRHDKTAEVVVMYDRDYGSAAFLPGLSLGLVIAHTGDNLGPPDLSTVRNIISSYEHSFPEAEVRAGSLDNFAAEACRDSKSLPVVTGEIGDTWIHGAATDPAKMSRFLVLQRLSSSWQEGLPGSPRNKKLYDFRKRLMMLPEHTWGMDENTFLKDYTRYKAADLKRLRRTKKCERFEGSWREQRAYIQQAVARLPEDLRAEAAAAINLTRPLRPETTGFKQVSPSNGLFNTPWLSIGFDGRTGDIRHLEDFVHGRTLAGKRNIFAGYTYETFSSMDYDRYGRQYLRGWPHPPPWAVKDFTKPGIEALPLESQKARPALKALWHRIEKSKDEHFILQMEMPKPLVRDYGAPSEVTTEVHIYAEQPLIDIIFQWFGKQACRLPEASWMSFCPGFTRSSGWSFKKMGVWMSPREVVRNGNRKLHAVERIRYLERDSFFEIKSLDAPLVAPGEPSLLNFNNRFSSLKRGMHYNLHNNIWGTNFPMWYEEDAKFRFRIALGRQETF